MPLTVKKMVDLDLAGKRVLIREDLNVPIKDGVVTSDARIRAALPSVRLAVEMGAKVILMSMPVERFMYSRCWTKRSWSTSRHCDTL